METKWPVRPSEREKWFPKTGGHEAFNPGNRYESTPADSREARMRALVIDDSRAVRMIIRKILQELGMEVVEAGNGREGVARLRENPNVDVMLVDWNMPEMNGLEFIQSVRSLRAFDRSKIVMVTTETEVSQMLKALEAGADEYVMKPFTRDVLIAKLRMLDLLETEE
jgi:two-component system chemotaxis response regulator CheY